MKQNFTKILLFLCLISASLILKAQNPLEKTISFSIKNQPIDSVLHLIEDITGSPFSYSNNILNNKEIISIKIKNKTVEEALGKIFKDKKLNFLNVDNHIVIKREN
ncbi:MAG: STN domain-containing protein, partial [Bacteroidales bacterium]|nr:STN domain-containing protein [Bacteroidales bacterium]